MRIALATGLITALLIAAACGDSPSSPTPTPTPTPTVTPPPIPEGLSAQLSSMLSQMPTNFAAWRTQLERDLPFNPQNAAYFQAKLFMLSNPELPAAVITNSRWFGARSSSGVLVSCVFPTDTMRGEAERAVQVVADGLPILEDFMGLAFPASGLRLWYGFVVGNSGGGGAIYSEDRTTYETRTGPSRLPFDAILGHESGHSYIGHESLNQFLELYVYNVMQTGSTSVDAWTFTRGWSPGAASNTGVAAVLDVYQLVGLEAMKRGYRAMYPLRPPYGGPIPVSSINAFVAELPEALRVQVAEKLGKVGF